jgi:hypothetical protein
MEVEDIDPARITEFDGESAPVVIVEDVPTTEGDMLALIVPGDVVANDPTSTTFDVINPADVAADLAPSVSLLVSAIVPLDADAEYPASMMPEACDAARAPSAPVADVPESCVEIDCVVAPGAIAVDRPSIPMDRPPVIDPAPVVVVAESPVSIS